LYFDAGLGERKLRRRGQGCGILDSAANMRYRESAQVPA
jgi:hypothetical protein